MSHGNILIVEDEEIIRASLKRLLERHGHTISEAGSVHEAELSYTLNDFDLIISDLRLPGSPGTEMINLAGDIPVLIMTSYASLNSAVSTMKLGAVDYIAKPFDHSEMLERVSDILARRPKVDHPSGAQSQNNDVDSDQEGFDGILGQCDAMRLLFRRIKKVAPTHATVLIQGESGTGKELVARSIHSHSTRSNGPMISVNCAAIPETLIESELFGHEKGSFTGATAARTGLIEAASGGTLFLDEIGELPLEAQARLLRVLQEGEIRRIGSVQSQKVDVRLIAATHRNLRQLAANSEFRQDLYYRLKVVELRIPALRERGKDILMLAEKLLDRVCEKLEQESHSYSPEAMAAICQHQWPGNVRELEHAIERAVILCDDNIITPEYLDLDVRVKASLFKVDAQLQHESPAQDGLTLEDYFQRFVLEHQEQMTETELAQKLGISRKTLWERRQKLGIPRKKASAS
ncbi:Fis family transcriptional regulator [Endozoicomonas montiporae]|uniref:Fis family transcriptional regulator n=2 Tax=Endozoicomonas montiporae TaxID=1027273 RepID=A0A081N1U5_9GAMM|nr:sigma-54 dependent transcriptional regulator [Endozoicomonas montiporae]AMO58640.1 sigma54-dependent response regulator, CbrB [Endozoicomonas montiporae CL-33]KEQ12418.1 Fis family transcriptional regulator [Endozoicomonas montiporae]